MTNHKHTKRALLSSMVSLVLCFAMLLGTTFAWFTDAASTSVNKIQAGTLDVALEVATEWDAEGSVTKWEKAEDKTLEFVKAKEAANGEAILWEPGATYKLPELRIVNNGNLALKYKVVITGINGDAELNNAIDWTIGDVAQGTEQHLAVGADNEFTISGTMKKTAGNDYQGLSIDSVAITVLATQDTVEYDSTTNQYDAAASLDFYWDGKTVAEPQKDASGVYHITNAAEFVGYIKSVHVGTNYSTAVLDCDIDLGGNTIEFSGEGYAFSGNFDGQNHTVSNYIIKRTDGKNYTGLFSCYATENASIKNLTVENGTVISNGAQVSAIIPSLYGDNQVVDNCHAINCTIVGEKKVGVITGYNNFGTVSNCSATDCSVYASDNRADQATVFGYNDYGTFESNTSENVTVTTNATVTTVSNAEELIATLKNGGNIVLTSDIDMANSSWNPEYNDGNLPYSATLNGNGKTITGLTNALFNCEANANITIKNLTINAANIDDTYADGLGIAAFIGYLDTACSATLENCHLKNSTINGTNDFPGVAGLVGYKSTYGSLTVKKCTIDNCEIKGVSNAAGIVAYVTSNATITDCNVTNSNITGENSNKTGDIIGTANGDIQITISGGSYNNAIGRTLGGASVNY